MTERFVVVGAHRSDGTTDDLFVEGGRIVAPTVATGAPRLDASGLTVLPRLADPHVHLDKSFIGGPWHSHRAAPDLAGRIDQELLALANPAERTVLERARALAKLLLARGSTLVRSHVDVSSTLGLSRLEAVLEVRQELSEVMTIVLVAFPQQGILAAPGTAGVLDEAMRLGVEAIGGLDPASFDGDRQGHLEVVFGLATRYDRRVDIHLHETGEPGLATMRAIAARTLAEGLEGRVCISHGFALATAPRAAVDETIDLLSQADVGLITSVPGSGLLPPIDRLMAAGVRVAVGSDNIRDSWSPFGRGDQLERSALAAYLLGWCSDQQLELCLTLATETPSFLLGDIPAALRVGDPADFVLVPASCVAEAVVTGADQRIVYRRGRRVAGPALGELPR